MDEEQVQNSTDAETVVADAPVEAPVESAPAEEAAAEPVAAEEAVPSEGSAE